MSDKKRNSKSLRPASSTIQGLKDFSPFGPTNITTSVSDPLFQSDRALVKHRYSEQSYKWTVPFGTSQFESYRMNDLYDPYIGTGGGSAAGFTLMSSQYTYFRVHKSRIRVQVNRDEHTFDDHVMLALAPITYGGTVPTSVEQLIAQPYSKNLMLSGAFGNRSCVELSHTMSIEKIQGERDIYTSAYQGGSASSPIIIPYWCIGLFNSNTGASAILGIKVTVEYWAEWTIRRTSPLAMIERAISFYRLHGQEEEKKALEESSLIPRPRVTRVSEAPASSLTLLVQPVAPLCTCHKVAITSCPKAKR